MKDILSQFERSQRFIRDNAQMWEGVRALVTLPNTFQMALQRNHLLELAGSKALRQFHIKQNVLGIPIDQFSKQFAYHNSILQQLSSAGVFFSGINSSEIARLKDMLPDYKNQLQTQLKAVEEKVIEYPSKEVVISTIKNELTETDFYKKDLTAEETVSILDNKIRESKEKSEWLTTTYTWLLVLFVSYILQLSVNYAWNGSFEFTPPAIDASVFIALLLKRDDYRYVKVDDLELKAIPKIRSKTMLFLESETEVKVIRQRKDWAYIRCEIDQRREEGWVLVRYLKKRKE